MIDDAILKMLAKAAKAAEEAEKAEKEPADIYAETKKDALHIAKINKILFDAHIEAGFVEYDAFALTTAMINNI